MSFKFNPFTGILEKVEVEIEEKIFTAIDEIALAANSELKLVNDAEALVKFSGFNNVQKILESVTILQNGELLIENNSAVEVLNV